MRPKPFTPMTIDAEKLNRQIQETVAKLGLKPQRATYTSEIDHVILEMRKQHYGFGEIAQVLKEAFKFSRDRTTIEARYKLLSSSK